MLSYIQRQIDWGNRTINGKTFSRKAHVAHLVTQFSILAIFIGCLVMLLRWTFY